MSDLKPCPFCGSEAIVPAVPIGITDDDAPVECTNMDCNASDVTFDKGAWNTRPIEDALQARIDELEKQVEWHLFDIDNVNTYPPCADMYLTLSIPERTEYREIDDEETYDVLWFELYSEEYWHKHNVTHWAYLPAPPQEEE